MDRGKILEARFPGRVSVVSRCVILLLYICCALLHTQCYV